MIASAYVHLLVLHFINSPLRHPVTFGWLLDFYNGTVPAVSSDFYARGSTRVVFALTLLAGVNFGSRCPRLGGQFCTPNHNHIDIQQVSIATLIISLGLLVDMPVVAGDAIKRALGQEPRSAWSAY